MKTKSIKIAAVVFAAAFAISAVLLGCGGKKTGTKVFNGYWTGWTGADGEWYSDGVPIWSMVICWQGDSVIVNGKTEYEKVPPSEVNFQKGYENSGIDYATFKKSGFYREKGDDDPDTFVSFVEKDGGLVMFHANYKDHSAYAYCCGVMEEIVFKRELKLKNPRMEGDDVGRVQTELAMYGLLESDPSGVGEDGFGPKTEKAVKEFQRTHDLAETGVVDKETWEVLFIGKRSGNDQNSSSSKGDKKASAKKKTQNPVKLAKSCVLDGTNTPLETLVKNFLGSPKWKSGVSEDEEVFVNISGKCTLNGKEINAVVQYIVDVDDETITFNALEFNEIPQNFLMYEDLLSAMCEASGDEFDMDLDDFDLDDLDFDDFDF